jgi:methionyl-tRNA formyltransferase
MRYALLGNGRAALEILQWLADRREPPVALVVHPDGQARDRSEIIEASGLAMSDVREAPALNHEGGAAWLAGYHVDWLISVYFGFLLRRPVLDAPRLGTLNLHPALLPHNRGAHPNVWSIVDRTPAGVTLHYVDEEVDTGDIAAQCEVPVHPADTAATLYRRLEDAAIQLFKECWPMIRADSVPRTPQHGTPTYHRTADLARLDRIDPNGIYRASDLIDLLRARTFHPYPGAYLDLGNRRVYLRLELEEQPTESNDIVPRQSTL